MKSKVKNFLKKYKLLEYEKTFLVGFSGGFDSVCLLDILYNLSLKNKFKVIALQKNKKTVKIFAKKEISLFIRKHCRKIQKKQKQPPENTGRIFSKSITKNSMLTDFFWLIQNQTIRKRYFTGLQKEREFWDYAAYRNSQNKIFAKYTDL